MRTQSFSPVLTEVALVREVVPGTLNKVEQLIDKSEEAGQHAAEGAVQGTITGVLSAPLNLIKKTTETVKEKITNPDSFYWCIRLSIYVEISS